MTASEKWLVMTALGRYVEDMENAEATAENMGDKEIARHFRENAMHARDLMERLNFGEV